MTVNEFAKEVHENAVAHGWWETARSFPEVAAASRRESPSSFATRLSVFSITSPIWAWTLRPFSWQSMSTTRGANTATEGNAPKPR